MSIISLVVFLIVIGCVFWAVKALSGAFGIPAPIVVVIQVIVVLIAVVWLLQMVGFVGGTPLRLR